MFCGLFHCSFTICSPLNLQLRSSTFASFPWKSGTVEVRLSAGGETDLLGMGKPPIKPGGGNSNMFYFHPGSLGFYDPIWLVHIFSNGVGWNHQLETNGFESGFLDLKLYPLRIMVCQFSGGVDPRPLRNVFKLSMTQGYPWFLGLLTSIYLLEFWIHIVIEIQF